MMVKKLTEKIELDVKAEGLIDGDCSADCSHIDYYIANYNVQNSGCGPHYYYNAESTTLW
jgi:hypothetical protein